jgi:hypothetical protein
MSLGTGRWDSACPRQVRSDAAARPGAQVWSIPDETPCRRGPDEGGALSDGTV